MRSKKKQFGRFSKKKTGFLQTPCLQLARFGLKCYHLQDFHDKIDFKNCGFHTIFNQNRKNQSKKMTIVFNFFSKQSVQKQPIYTVLQSK